MIVIENIDHVCLAVNDIEKSIEFYRDFFGFDVVEHMSGSPDALLQVGDIRLKLTSDDGGKNKSNGYVAFYVDEEDFEDALEEIEENNLTVVSGPDDYRAGKSIIIQDLSGNRIALCYSKK
ncbi:MAG TPA: VOC family protein [Spirochaetota bacterium]